MPVTTYTIAELPDAVGRLPAGDRKIFDRIFNVSTTIGELVAPVEMHDWIDKFFGSVEVVSKQKIIKVTNLVTMEGSLFNELRASRPIETKLGEELKKAISKSEEGPFCHPKTGTPADVFGRIESQYSITASNVAKYDGLHGLVIFSRHDPLTFTREGVRDHFATARRWAEAALAYDPAAKYYFVLWNCLWKSGASIVHGHAQVAMTRDMQYAKIEGLRRVAAAYHEREGGNYFEDLFRLHDQLGLAWTRDDVRGFAYLTPIKEKEIILLADKEDNRLYDEIYRIVDLYLELGVRSFNLALYQPPLAQADEDWSGFPVMVRLVDRGDPNNKTADFGAMELYASSVVSSDPFRVAEYMQK